MSLFSVFSDAAQVSGFGWCGSAVLGGYLVDSFDYSFTFLLTALIQGSAVAIWVGLLPLVPRREQKAASSTEEEPAASSSSSSTNSRMEASEDVQSPLNPSAEA